MWENSREHKSWLLEYCNNFEDEVLGMLRTVIWEVFELKKKKNRKLMFCVLVNIHCCEKTELWNIAVCRLQYFKYCSVCFSTFSIYYPWWYPRWQKRTPFFLWVVLASLKTAMLLWISVYLNSYCLNYKKTWEVYNDVKCLLVLRLSTKFKLVTVWQKVERKRPLQALAFSKAWF